MKFTHSLFVFLVCSLLHGQANSGWGEEQRQTEDSFRPPAIHTNNVPVIPREIVEGLRQYQNVRSASFRGWAPDGRGILIQTRFGNTSQLYRVYRPGGRREQVTFFDEPAGGRFLPGTNDGSLLVNMSSGGNEDYQAYIVKNGRALRITDGKSRNLTGPILKDGSRLIVANNSRNGKDTDLYIADLSQPGTIQADLSRPARLKRILETKDEYWRAVDWSPDKFTLAINHYVSINESYPALLDVALGSLSKRAIPAPAPGKVSFGDLAFSFDGKHLYAACDAIGEFRHLARIDTRTFDYQWLSTDIPWNVSEIEIQPKTGTVAFTTNEDGASALYLLADINQSKEQQVVTPGGRYLLQADKPTRVDLPLGIIGSLEFSPDGRRIGFTFSPPDAPSEVYSLNLSDGKLMRWTYSEVGGLDTSLFNSPERIKYPTFDDKMIPAYYFKPTSATKQEPAAVVINIHGGPESQYRPYFSSFDQFLLNEFGIAVIRPNVRGSAGYGKTYVSLDNGENREDSVKDIGALLEWVESQPELDESRVAVYGGSYGGYMVLASMAHFPERIKAGVDIVGLASFTTFLKNTKAYRRDLRRAEYGDERDPKMAAIFQHINPTSNVHKIDGELLVAHGKNDPRVPFVVAEEVVEKVEATGRKVWTIYADNEGHGFRKKANRDYLTAAIVMFLWKQLK